MSHTEANEDGYKHEVSQNEGFLGSETSDGKPKSDSTTGEEFSAREGESTAPLDAENSVTESADEELAVSLLIKAATMVDRDNKIMNNLLEPVCDSEENAALASDEEEIEWVTGDLGNGFTYKVPKDFYEAGERMNDRELREDTERIYEKILDKLERNRKAAMDRMSMLMKDADDFLPPAAFFATPESDTSKQESST